MNLTHVILNPVITEKSHIQTQTLNRFTFKVAKSATKKQIAAAIEKYFNVTVVKINTITNVGERRRTGKKRLPSPITPSKKAIVQLKKDQTIKIFNQNTDK